MVKISSALFLTAAVISAAPTLAFDATLEHETRSLVSFGEDQLAARALIEAVYGRELTDVELQEREPFLGLIFAAARIGMQVGTRVAGRVAGRVGSKIARKGVKKGAEHANNERHKRKHGRRSLNELDDDLGLLSRGDFEDILELEEREFSDANFEVRDFDGLD